MLITVKFYIRIGRLVAASQNCTVNATVPIECLSDYRKLIDVRFLSAGTSLNKLNFSLSQIRRIPDLTDMPKVNPLDLTYFMWATVVMSFGLGFGIISLTWLK